MKTFTRLLLLVVLLALSVRQASAQLDGISEVGHSYQSDARGGCEVSIGDTALSHVRQPASVMLQTGAKFDSKLTNIFPINRWKSEAGSAGSLVNNLFSYNLGAVTPLGERSALGIAWEVGGWNTRFNNKSLFSPLLNATKSSFGFRKYDIYINYGRRITRKLSIGLGPHFDISNISTNLPVLNGLVSFPKSTAFGAGYQVGALYDLTAKIRLGASYASSTYMGTMNNENVQAFLPSGAAYSVKERIKPFTLPGRISFGASMTVTPKLKAALEAGYLNYGNSLLGKVNLTGPYTGSYYPGFKNLWVINSGFDYDINRHWSCSAGYVYNTGSVQPQNMVPFNVANEQNQITCGLRFRKGRWWTGFAYIVGIPSSSHSNPTTHLALGPSYQHNVVTQMLQSFNTGVGFSF